MKDKSKVRIGPLDTVGHTATELARVYRHMRRGEIEGPEGERFARVLTMLRGALEVTEIEQRITALESTRKTRP